MKKKKSCSVIKSEWIEAENPSAEITMRHPGLMEPLQMAGRLMIMLFAAIGINGMWADALRLESSFGLLLWPILFWLVLLTLLFRSKKSMLLGFLLAGVGFGLIGLLEGQNPIRYIAGGAALLWNRLMSVIDSMGYMTLPAIGEGLVRKEQNLFFLTSMISCLVFFLSLRRKTRIFPLIVYLLIVCAPLFIYNMLVRNEGPALVAAALVGVVTMRLCEKHTEKYSPSGFVGAMVLLLSFLLLLVPMLRIHEPWSDIPGIAEKIDAIRQIVTDIAEGRPISLGALGGAGSHDSPRDVTATKRNFRGKHVMTVYADSRSTMYLREWVGGTYQNNSWYTPDIYNSLPPGDRLDSIYANPFFVTENFLEAYALLTGEENERALGLYRSDVVVVPIGVGTLMPLPVTTVSDLMTPYGEELGIPYRYTSDYIYISNRLSAQTPYQVEALLPYTDSTEAYEQFLEAFYWYMLYVENGILPEEGTLAYEMAKHFGQDGLRSTINTVRARNVYAESLYSELTDTTVIDRIVDEIFRDTDIEQYYNLSGYEEDMASYGQAGVITIKTEDGRNQTYYLSSLAEVLYADEVAFLVASYLQDRCTYTLDPAKATSKDAMEEFLYYSKEGYCVQYATAATLIMRRLGFTARYAEGYLANSFREAINSEFPQRYTARVQDRNAHAWMEVWIRGYGWKLYEVTPGYYEDFFFGTETQPGGDSEPPSSQEPDPTDSSNLQNSDTTEPLVSVDRPVRPIPPDESTGELPEEPGPDLTPYGLGLISLFIVVWGIWLLNRRGKRYLAAKEKRIRLALAGCSDEERISLGETLAKDLTDALHAHRLMPLVGERPGDFGKRVETALVSLPLELPAARAVQALSHSIYGGVTDAEDVVAMAIVTKGLMTFGKRRLGMLRFGFYRWIRCML